MSILQTSLTACPDNRERNEVFAQTLIANPCYHRGLSKIRRGTEKGQVSRSDIRNGNFSLSCGL